MYTTTQTAITTSKPRFPSAPKCFACQKSVFAAEEAVGPAGRKYHKTCLVCGTCGKRLDALHLVDHDADPYCKPCHTKNFGPKGYGHGGVLSPENLSPARPTRSNSSTPAASPNAAVRGYSFSKPDPSPIRTPSSWAAPDLKADEDQEEDVLSAEPDTEMNIMNPPSTPTRTGTEPTSPESQSPFSINVRSRGAPASPLSMGNLARALPPSSPTNYAASTGSMRSVGSTPTSSTPPRFTLRGTGDLCRRCGKSVYFAEQALAVGQKWHKACLRCAACDTSLSSHLSEKDGLPYCKKCYSSNFGAGALGYLK